MSIQQLLVMREMAEVDMILGALYSVVGSICLLCIWHVSHTRRQLEKQNRKQIRREWRALNLRGLN